jgi:hypothetical protein
MNEQIKELAIQAGYKINDKGNIYTVDYDAVCNNELSKFAKLIVLECIDIVDQYGKANMESDALVEMLTKMQMDIRQHFGVE